MGSTRLPGKVLMTAVGKPLILHMLERVSRSETLDELWLATSELERDNVLADCVTDAGYQVFRGSEEDVLSRYYTLARSRRADVVVRLTGDCPLHDPAVIDHVVGRFLKETPPSGYGNNTLRRTYPVGLDTEVMTFAALERAHREATSQHDREHVTPYLYRAPHEVLCVQLETDFSHLRWTLDTEADYQLIREVFRALWTQNSLFSWHDALDFVTRRPDLITFNVKNT